MRRIITFIAVLVAAGGLFVVTAGFTSKKRPVYTVRAVFDDASFAVPGEDVRIAGANVGSIQSLGVTQNKRAAVTISIENRAFVPFHANA
ncbi:MAG: MlaD family protein, partial [Solirubrobacteraceae bacterium]